MSARPARPVSPPRLGARSETAPTGPSLQTTAAEPDDDGLGGFLSEVRIGARFLKHHSASVMFAHISNADLCDNNEGLDTLGVRCGYKF